MNKQGKLVNGKVVGGIEWTKTVNDEGAEKPGYTWNPIGGCKHACRWAMPDGSIAKCYAEEQAGGVAQAAYPEGFEAHYWRPNKLNDPLKVKKPARIFLDSMSDLMGHWVPDEQIEKVLDVCREADWHTFQLLTKNAPRLLKFDFPPNVWVGVSSPPDFMWGKPVSRESQEKMLTKSLEVLSQLSNNVTWISAEPLSWDISGIVELYPMALEWCVIGAASNGKTKYQPDPAYVENLLGVLDRLQVPTFFKGNLDWSPHREDFPDLMNSQKYCAYCAQYLSPILKVYDGRFCTQACAWAYEIPF